MTSNSHPSNDHEHDKTPLIENKPLQRYYASLESRIGYRLVLGGTRHFGTIPLVQYGLFLSAKLSTLWKTTSSQI